jgi:hypothetical protein
VPRLQWQQIPAILALAVIVICFGYAISLSSDPKIAPISNSSNNALLHSQKAYHDAAEQILGSSLLNSTKITIDTDHFNDAMKQRFPELSEASITLPLMGRRPIVELAVVQPTLILTNQHGTYVLDSNGRAILSLSSTKSVSNLQLPVVTDQTNLPVSPGKGALTNQDVSFITGFVTELKSKQLQVSSLVLPPVANQLLVHVTGLNYYIKCSLIADPRISAGEFLALKQQLDTAHTPPSEYMDVRLEEKVYYK